MNQEEFEKIENVLLYDSRWKYAYRWKYFKNNDSKEYIWMYVYINVYTKQCIHIKEDVYNEITGGKHGKRKKAKILHVR